MAWSTAKLLLSMAINTAIGRYPVSNSHGDDITRNKLFGLDPRETWPSFANTLASLAEYSWSAAIAFSALLSCETPTTALRIRMVRI
jgi:hypothetical protein